MSNGKNEKRIKVTLACEECKRRNYITVKNKINDRERIEMKKYCRGTASTRPTRRPANADRRNVFHSLAVQIGR